MGSNGSVLSSLDGKSPTLFLVGGASLVGYTTLLGASMFLDKSYPLVREVILGPAGYVLGFLALLGLYPVLVDRNPKLARVGAVFAALGAVGWIAMGVTRLVEETGGVPPNWLGVFGLLIPLGFVFGYLVFGAASLRSDVYSRTVGLVLLSPLLGVVLNFVLKPVGVPLEEGRIIIVSWFALAHLAIGSALVIGIDSTGRAGPHTAEV